MCQIILSLLTGKKVVFHYLYRFKEKEHPYVYVVLCVQNRQLDQESREVRETQHNSIKSSSNSSSSNFKKRS